MTTRLNQRNNQIKLLSLIVVFSLVIDIILLYRICALFLFLGCILWGIKEKSIINPYYLFSITPLTLACYTNLSDSFMLDMSNDTWRLCVINIFAFIIALYFTKDFTSIGNCIGIKTKRDLYIHATVMYVFSSLTFALPFLSSILWLFRVASFVCFIKTKDKKAWIIVGGLMALIVFSGQASKMEIFLDVFIIAISYIKYYGLSSKDRLKIALMLGVALSMVILSFSIETKGRGKPDSERILAGYSNRIDWNGSALLFLPYMYLETPWANVEYVVQTQNKRTNGLWMIKPVLGYIGLDDHYEKEYELDPYSSFNTFTFITPCFKDFGIWFSALSSLFLGFFVKKVYSRFLISRSPFDVACYVAVSLATVEMFFSNHFYMQSYPFTIIILMEMYKLLVKNTKGKCIELESNYK